MNARSAPPALTIGQMAETLGVTHRTLRFWNAQELLVPERRGSARIYRHHHVRRAALILRYQDLGLSLREIFDKLAATDRHLWFTEAERARLIETHQTRLIRARAALDWLRLKEGPPA